MNSKTFRTLTVISTVIQSTIIHDQLKIIFELRESLVITPVEPLLHTLEIHRLPDDRVVIRSVLLVDRIHEGPSVVVILDVVQDLMHPGLEILGGLSKAIEWDTIIFLITIHLHGIHNPLV